MLLKSQQDGEFAASEFGHVMTRYRRVTHDTMRPTLDSFRLLLIFLAGCLNQQQQEVIDYLQEENRVLREQLGDRRLRLNDYQRRRLAVNAQKLGRGVLH